MVNQICWNLKLIGRFQLTSPAGVPVVISNRKVQALIAILSLNRPLGMNRDELSRILWPAMTVAKRSNNFRQTLARAREAIGADHVESNRTHCFLAETFELHIDVVADLESGNPHFLPGFEGDWFDQIRKGTKSNSVQLIASFLQVLQWLAQHDPSRMLGFMRENLGMTLGFTLAERKGILGSVREDPALPGWATFFRATLLDGGYAKAEEDFRRVLTMAEASGDILLGVQASAQLCISGMLQSRFSDAHGFASLCAGLAAKSGDKGLVPTATQIQGMAFLLRGRQEEGFAQLEMAEQQYKVYLDSVIIRALRGYFLATYGRFTEADQCLEIPRKMRDETGHGLLKMICALADSQILGRNQDIRDSIDHHRKTVEFSEAFHDARFTVVSNEELALAYLKLGEVPLAKPRAITAKQLRKSMSMSYTPWDQMRLAKQP